jgi:CHAT domain-containing protein
MGILVIIVIIILVLRFLSACKTGLGDIKGSEGVYGMQRALKMAGVEYLLMSLWKVPDAATSEYMTIFYENLFKNKNIETAYQKAQKDMKKKYPHEVEKWGGFVLVR